MTGDEIRDLLPEMKDEPVPVESLVQVRLRVADRMRRRAPSRILTWAAAFAALFLAGVVFEGTKTVSRIPVAQLPVVSHAENPSVELPHLTPAPVLRHAIRRKRRLPEPAPAPALIRIETPDPDVVILLVSN
jgi:hypothetical protein